MSGKDIVRIIEKKLFEKGISKAEFYAACGMNSATLSNWRNNTYQPSEAKLAIIENYLDIRFADYEEERTEELDDDVAEILQMLKDNYAYKTVCRSAMNLTSAKAFEAAAFIERLKEGE